MRRFGGWQRNASAFLFAPLRAAEAMIDALDVIYPAAHVFALTQFRGDERVTARETGRHIVASIFGSAESRRVEISRWPSAGDLNFGLRLKCATVLGGLAVFVVPFAAMAGLEFTAKTATALFGVPLPPARPARRVDTARFEGTSVKVQFAPR